VRIDAESALLDQLTADGVTYTVVKQLNEFDSSSIPGLPLSFLDRDVLLARPEPARQLTLANSNAQHFATLLTLPLAPGLNATILRGWISVDATVRGRTVRMIATHLESFHESVQEAQALELSSGPGDTSLPVVIAGDLNTGPGSSQTAGYTLLTQSAGFTDTSAVTQPTDPGFTDPFSTRRIRGRRRCRLSASISSLCAAWSLHPLRRITLWGPRTPIPPITPESSPR